MANFQRNLSKYIVVVLTRRTEHEPSQVCSRGCSGAGRGCSHLRQRLGHAEWAVVGRAGVQRGAGALGLRAVSVLVAAQLLWLGTAVGLALRLAPLVTSVFAGGPNGPPAFLRYCASDAGRACSACAARCPTGVSIGGDSGGASNAAAIRSGGAAL